MSRANGTPSGCSPEKVAHLCSEHAGQIFGSRPRPPDSPLVPGSCWIFFYLLEAAGLKVQPGQRPRCEGHARLLEGALTRGMSVASKIDGLSAQIDKLTAK
jgi:hypothetical protein